MKKIIVFISLFVSVTAGAQNNAVENTTAKPIITESGKPVGEKAEMKIGKEGGSFTSSDGKIRLKVPEGAVSKNTTFSIQPATNLLPNGNGKTYRIEPSGINFQKPLQIIFYYADDVEKNTGSLLGVAMQDEKGKWFSVNKAVNDTISKTLAASINHFSSYTYYLQSHLSPKSARVKVNESLRIKILRLVPLESDDDLLAPLGETEINVPDVWSVNGIPRGNSAVGLVSASQNKSAIYQAPAQVPQQNPVAVTVQPDNSLKSTEGKLLVSNITVYDDAYEVKMEAFLKGGSPDAWGGVVTYKDEGSFVVSLEKDKPAVINIKNKLEVVTDNCLKIISNPTTCTGILHVAGTKQIKITPANPPSQPYPIVEIWFTQYPTELTRFTFDCPPPPGAKDRSRGKVGLTTGSPPPMLMFFGMPALPTYLKFIAKDEEQILIEKGSPGGDIYYKFSVRKLKDD
jgi:hypothetical protein